MRNEIEFLMDEGEAGLFRRLRRARPSSSPSTRIVPSSGTVTPGEAPNERRLAGAVRADKAVHLAARDVHVDVAQSDFAGEVFAEPRISIQASGIPFAPGSPRTALTPAASETIRMVGEELVDVVLGHDDARDLDRLRLPGFSGRDRVEDRLEHGLALR